MDAIYTPSELARRALIYINVTPYGSSSREAIAWNVAFVAAYGESRYEIVLRQRFALALLRGDSASIDLAAEALVDPDAAIERALAEICQPKIPTLDDVIAAWRTSGLSSRIADDLARYASMSEETARAFLTGVVKSSLETAEACPDSAIVTERAEAMRVSRAYLGGAP